jgi:hypothetical protein
MGVIDSIATWFKSAPRATRDANEAAYRLQLAQHKLQLNQIALSFRLVEAAGRRNHTLLTEIRKLYALLAERDARSDPTTPRPEF